MSKHTEGPWTVDRLDRNGQAVVKAEHIEVATCWHHCVGSIEKEMYANARLIAAAPDLLEALILMVRTHDEPAETLIQEAKEQQWLAKARAAIAKATQ